MPIYYNPSLTAMDLRVEQWKFPGGEVGVRLPNVNSFDLKANEELVDVAAFIENSDDVMALVMATDALRSIYNNAKFNLMLCYLPYARQDRIAVAGESNSIRAFARLINSLGYANVILIDPHSDVAPPLFNNVVVYSQLQMLKIAAELGHINMEQYDVIVGPDAGSMKKCRLVAAYFGIKEVVNAEKVRNPVDGSITDMKIDLDVKGKNILVVDDICDGGKTFVELGKLLIGKGEECNIDLYVTHGLFTKGFDALSKYYRMIYAYNTQNKEFDNIPFWVEMMKMV